MKEKNKYNKLAASEFKETLCSLISKKKAEYILENGKFPKSVYLKITLFRALKAILLKLGMTISDLEKELHLTIKTTNKEYIRLS